jgi:hypothetical protein
VRTNKSKGERERERERNLCVGVFAKADVSSDKRVFKKPLSLMSKRRTRTDAKAVEMPVSQGSKMASICHESDRDRDE